MTLKAPIEVRSIKKANVTVQTSLVSSAVTAEFVNRTPMRLNVVESALKSVSVGRKSVDIRALNRGRRGLKRQEAESTESAADDQTS